MAAIENENIYGLHLRESANDGSDFGSADSDYRKVFLGEDGRLYGKDSAGAVVALGSGALLNAVSITSDVTVTGTSEAGGTTVITSGSVTVDGSTTVEIEFFTPDIQFLPNSLGNQMILDLYEDSTILGRINAFKPSAAASTQAAAFHKLRRTPSAGSHTYTVKGWKSNASDTAIVKAGAGGTGAFVAAYIKIARG